MPFVAERNLWTFFPQIKNTLQTLSSARCQFQFTHIRTHTLTQTPKDTRSYYLWPIAVHISWHVLGNFFLRMLCSKLPPIKFISLKSFHLIFIDSVAPQTHTHERTKTHIRTHTNRYGTRLSHRLHYVVLLRMFVAYLSFYYVYVTNQKMPCCKFLTQLVSLFPLGSKIENISPSTKTPSLPQVKHRSNFSNRLWLAKLVAIARVHVYQLIAA